MKILISIPEDNNLLLPFIKSISHIFLLWPVNCEIHLIPSFSLDISHILIYLSYEHDII